MRESLTAANNQKKYNGKYIDQSLCPKLFKYQHIVCNKLTTTIKFHESYLKK